MGWSGDNRVEEGTDLPEAILDAAGAAIVAVDSEGRVVHWNRTAAAVTGIPAEQIVLKDFHETVLFPADLQRWKGELARISAGNKPALFECRWKAQDSSFVFLTCSCSIIRDAVNGPHVVCTAMRSFSRDFMTDRIVELREISHFLHNTISQNLAALSLNLSQAGTASNERRTEDDRVSALIDGCCRDIRLISYMLAPPAFTEITLDAAIALDAEFVREETALPITLDLDPFPDVVSTEATVLVLAAVHLWLGRGIRTRVKPAISIGLKNRGGGSVLDLDMVLPVVTASVGGWSAIRERALALGGDFVCGGDGTRLMAKLSLPDLRGAVRASDR